MAPSGYLCLILHAHLPFVRHVEHEDSLEERWLFQAITESYLPLLDRLFRLHREGVRFSLTVLHIPALLQMLDDDLLKKRYKRHLSICTISRAKRWQDKEVFGRVPGHVQEST